MNFLIHKLDVFPYFHNQKIHFFQFFFIFLILTGNFESLKSSFLAKSLSAFVILAGLGSAEFKYLNKHQLNCFFLLVL